MSQAQVVRRHAGQRLTQLLPAHPTLLVVADSYVHAEYWAHMHHLGQRDFRWVHDYHSVQGLSGTYDVYVTGEALCLNEDYFYYRLMELCPGSPMFTTRQSRRALTEAPG